MTDAERASRWSRRFVFAGAAFLVVWQVGELAGIGSRAGVTLGLLGFVFHTVFGKAYSLVPTYFDRDLATTRLLSLQFGLSVAGTVLLAVAGEFPDVTGGPVGVSPGVAGAVLWVAGVAVFLGTLFWTIRGNLSGRATGTGEHNAHRRGVDRLANLFVPIALLYLGVGSYALVAGETALPTLVDGYPPRATHLLAAGSGALLVFAIGFRLLPRFLVATPPRPLVALVLPAGAVGPALLAVDLPAGQWFRAGAVLQTLALVGFAVAFWVLYDRSDRRRVGFYAVLACTVAGLLAAALGLTFAFDTPTVDLLAAHRRLTVLGFLGLAIVGVSYQFYPPAVGTFPGAGDRTALAAIVLLFGGLLIESGGLAAGVGPVVLAGQGAGVVGAAAHCYLLAGLFRERYG